MGASLARACVVGILVVVPSAIEAQQGRFSTAVDLVSVGVTVLDKRGDFVTNLTPDNFELYEEGRKQEVSFFARGDAQADAERLHLGLLFDTSGSMNDDISFSRSAAIRFLNTLHEAEDITLVDFDTEVRIARYGQADFPRLVERIRTRKPDGWTALYDALGAYLGGAQDLDGRKVLVVYTDGGDTRSAVTFSNALDMLRTVDVTLYVVGFLEHQPHSVRNGQRMQLMQMAETTGGQAFFPTSRKTLDEMYTKVAAQIRAQYSLGFTPANSRPDGKWRRLEVRLVGDDLEGLKVRCRPGYFAPLRGEALRKVTQHQ